MNPQQVKQKEKVPSYPKNAKFFIVKRMNVPVCQLKKPKKIENPPKNSSCLYNIISILGKWYIGCIDKEYAPGTLRTFFAQSWKTCMHTWMTTACTHKKKVPFCKKSGVKWCLKIRNAFSSNEMQTRTTGTRPGRWCKKNNTSLLRFLKDNWTSHTATTLFPWQVKKNRWQIWASFVLYLLWIYQSSDSCKTGQKDMWVSTFLRFLYIFSPSSSEGLEFHERCDVA